MEQNLHETIRRWKTYGKRLFSEDLEVRDDIPSHVDELVWYAELMENIWDWKEFITPHLYLNKDIEFTKVSELHHFRFFQWSSRPHVQHKIYANDAWVPTDGHPFLISKSDVWNKPGFESDHEEIATLSSFVSLKECQFVRHAKLQVLEQVLELYQKATVETEAFMEYLDRFPKIDRAEVHESLQFWWTTSREEETNIGSAHIEEGDTELETLLSLFSFVERHGYFGPWRKAPQKDILQCPVVKKQKVGPHTTATVGIAISSSLNQVISNALHVHRQRWYLFDPYMVMLLKCKLQKLHNRITKYFGLQKSENFEIWQGKMGNF
jgi:hypothetical protein